MYYCLMLPRTLIKCHLKLYLIYYLIKMYAPRLFCYYILCIQLCHAKWGGEKSASFPISNGVKQGGVISLLLFSLYVNDLFLF